MPNAQPFTNGQQVQIYNGEKLLSAGVVKGEPTAPPLILNATDSPFVHDSGAFTDYRAWEGGGVSCYNASMNMPFWNAGTCNCHFFGVDADMAKHAAQWATPSTGVVRMFHSARWGGWAFEVDQFNPDGPPPTPAPPPPPPGWGPLVQCTSCLPHDNPIKKLSGGGTLQVCCTVDGYSRDDNPV